MAPVGPAASGPGLVAIALSVTAAGRVGRAILLSLPAGVAAAVAASAGALVLLTAGRGGGIRASRALIARATLGRVTLTVLGVLPASRPAGPRIRPGIGRARVPSGLSRASSGGISRAVSGPGSRGAALGGACSLARASLQAVATAPNARDLALRDREVKHHLKQVGDRAPDGALGPQGAGVIAEEACEVLERGEREEGPEREVRRAGVVRGGGRIALRAGARGTLALARGDLIRGIAPGGA